MTVWKQKLPFRFLHTSVAECAFRSCGRLSGGLRKKNPVSPRRCGAVMAKRWPMEGLRLMAGHLLWGGLYCRKYC